MELSLQHISKKDPAILQRSGLSGGATSADSKQIYPIDVSNTNSDSVMYVCISVCMFYVLFLCVIDHIVLRIDN